MKQVTRNLFITLIIVLLGGMSCTEVVNDLEPYMEPVISSDSIMPIDALLIEEQDSLAEEIQDSLSLIPKKCIYLTIDDAPLNGTARIDSIVSKAKVKTNIFMVGNCIDGSGKFRKYYNLLMENSYIEIYNHSYSHANNKYATFYKDPEKVLADFEKNQLDFSIRHKIARLPGRNIWQIGEKTRNYKQSGATSAELLVENGYKVFGWDVEWRYNAKDYTPEQTIEELINEIETLYDKSRTFSKNHVVLLMHDQMFAKKNDMNDLETLISELKEKGFSFEYLSSYPE